MTIKKTRENENKNVLRVPKQKQKLGLFVPQINMPHLELVKTENAPEEKVSEPTLTTLTSQSSQSKQASISPQSNYQKVPNSLTKQAIPAGLFKGKAKQLYDVLYSMTRGAIMPARTIRVRKGELMRKANIGSRITFESNITHLQAVGLIRETVFAGEHAGNEFEVLTFEEMETMPSQSSQTSDTSLTSPSQKLVRLVSLETSQTSQSLNLSETVSYEKPKTLFKTFLNIDDEMLLADVFQKLNEAARATTGKDLTQKDWEAFAEIIELIINETSIARTRAKSVSVYLKFAAENLRRRLYSKTLRYDKNPKMFEPGSGKVAEAEFIAEPLGENRELILENLRKIVEAGGRESIDVFAGNYLPEDWKWLVTNL